MAGLIPLKPDWRDRRFHTSRVFGAPSLDLPDNYDIEAVKGDVTGFRDQGSTQFCTAYATTELQSDEFGEPMDENYQVAMISRVAGKPITAGADLRDAMKALVLYGSLPKKYAELTWQKDGEEAVADWTKWHRRNETLAAPFKRTGYFMVTGPYDAFDNVRATLYQHGPNNDLVLGTPWYQSFSLLDPGNIIRRCAGSFTWHAYVVKGWKTEGGEVFLKVKSWNRVNRSPYFWMTREVANRLHGTAGTAAFMAKDTPADLIEALKEQKVSLAEIALDYGRTLLWKLQLALQQAKPPPAGPSPVPVPLPAPQPAPSTPDRLEAWAKAIQAFEGWHPGSVSFTHNNPGNIKGANGAFLTFKTYADGLAYLEDYLTRAATGKHPAFKPDMTLNQFFHIYTSDKEPVPTNYAKSVATAIGCTVDTQIADLVAVVS